MTLAPLSRVVAFTALAALSLTAAQAQTPTAPQAAPNPVTCPMYGNGMHGGMMGPGMMHGGGPAAAGDDWKQMREQMQAMHQQMQAIHKEMMELRQEMHRRK